MRAFAPALCIAWILFSGVQQAQPPQDGKAKQNATDKTKRNPESNTHKRNKPAPSQPPAPPSDKERDRENPGDYQNVVVATPEKSVDAVERVITIIGVICTVALTIVGIVGICVAIKTLRALRIQAVIMRRQTRHVARQALSMRRQTTHLKNSVEAAKEGTLIAKTSAEAAKASADAASKNIELFISKERARLRVDLKPLNLAPRGDFYTVDFTVSPYGATPASIVEAKCSAHEWPISVIDDPELMDRAMTDIHGHPSFPKAISPNAEPIEAYTFLFPQDGPEGLMLSEVKAARLFVVIRGFIKYKDVFDTEHETRFRYVWKYQAIYGMADTDFGNWEECGPPEHNQNT